MIFEIFLFLFPFPTFYPYNKTLQIETRKVIFICLTMLKIRKKPLLKLLLSTKLTLNSIIHKILLLCVFLRKIQEGVGSFELLHVGPLFFGECLATGNEAGHLEALGLLHDSGLEFVDGTVFLGGVLEFVYYVVGRQEGTGDHVQVWVALIIF